MLCRHGTLRRAIRTRRRQESRSASRTGPLAATACANRRMAWWTTNRAHSSCRTASGVRDRSGPPEPRWFLIVEGRLDLPALPVEGDQLVRCVLLAVQPGRAPVRDLVVPAEGDDAVGRPLRQDPALAGRPETYIPARAHQEQPGVVRAAWPRRRRRIWAGPFSDQVDLRAAFASVDRIRNLSGPPFQGSHVRRVDRAPRPVQIAAGAPFVEDQAVQFGPHPGLRPLREPPVSSRPDGPSDADGSCCQV